MRADCLFVRVFVVCVFFLLLFFFPRVPDQNGVSQA